MNLNDLKTPFDPSEIEFRAGATNQDKTKALALAFITSRAVMDRLDEVCGPENWQDVYMAGPDGGVLCGISVKVGDVWITKFDGADNSDVEAVKGGLSDAFKRAGVKWGIGRYLYNLPDVWVTATQRGKSVVINEEEARQKVFGKQPAQATKAPTAASLLRGETQAKKPTPGEAPGFTDLTSMLYQFSKDFGLTESESRNLLKKLGFSGFPANGEAAEKSKQMYRAVKAHVEAKK